MTKKGQAWSMDIIIGVTVFVVAFIVFYILLSRTPVSDKGKELSNEGEVFINTLEAGSGEVNISFIRQGEIVDEEFAGFSGKNYETLKTQLGIKNDFVIHFEDEDGNIIQVGGKYCFGSPDAKVVIENSTDRFRVNCG